MKLDQLRRMALFALVAKEGSFTRVANQQGIATSAVSAAISQLEAELNAQLLYRSTRKITLTDVGQAFFQRCQMMLNEAESAHETISELTGQLAGQLTLSASLLELQTLIIPALAPLLAAHPKLVLNLQADDRQVDLVAQNIDIAIRVGQLNNTNVVARPLMVYQEVIVAAPLYLHQYGQPKQIEDLRQHRIIGFTPFSQPDVLTFVTAKGQTQSATLTMAAKTNAVGSVMRLCQLGLGLARLPRIAVAEFLQSGELVQVLPTLALPTIQLYAVTLKRDLQPPKVVAAIEAIKTYIQQHIQK